MVIRNRSGKFDRIPEHPCETPFVEFTPLDPIKCALMPIDVGNHLVSRERTDVTDNFGGSAYRS